jgi:proteasome lid subunit RPN8/RPN11
MGQVVHVRELLIPARIERAVIAHLRAELPNEGCGLLATVDDAGGVRRVVHFYPGDNIDRSPTRYQMDPRQVMEALDDLEGRGWDLGAIVHSHPRSEPVPSHTDLNEAYYAESLLAIVSFTDEPPRVRSWRLEPEGAATPFTEIRIRIGDDPPD